MKTKEFLAKYDATGYFILDSHQEAMDGQETHHNDNDYIGYAYNVHHFNKLKPGSFFLYRRPGKLSPDNKFHIYGGGIVDYITEPNEKGDVVAKIKNPFVLKDTLSQGDPFIENFKWKTRDKPGPGWKGFWINYGMNTIVKDDFFGLISETECYPKRTLNNNDNIVYDEENVELKSTNETYSLSVNNDVMKHRVLKLNFDKINSDRKRIGTAGELLVVEYEKNRLKEENINKEVEHVAVTRGDGLGYDVLSYDSNGNEIHIEVKTTKTSNKYDFYMSSRELDESKSGNYKIYRLYNFDDENNTSDLLVIDEKINDENFELKPTNYFVKKKC